MTDLFQDPAPIPDWALARPIAPVYKMPVTPEALAATCCQGPMPHCVHLTAVVSARGVKMITAECTTCSTTSMYVKHADVPRLFGCTIDSVPVSRDNACWACDSKGCSQCCPDPCERCRRHVPTHRHHTAPRAMFQDADLWPQVYLCAPCHSFWHSVMTPGIRWNPRPLATHLQVEWDRARDARLRLIANNHDVLCECRWCVVDRSIIDEWHEVYGWSSPPTDLAPRQESA